MVSRKNEGTVKMTRQRATSKIGLLGMTGGNGTLDGYLRVVGEKTPREMAAEKASRMLAAERVGKSVDWRKEADVTYKLCFQGSIYWWVKKEPHGTTKSIVYRSKSRALRVFQLKEIVWAEFHIPGEENDCVPWTSYKPHRQIPASGSTERA